MKKYCIAIIAAFLVFSCNQKENVKIIPVNSTDTIVTEKDSAANKDLNTQQLDTISMLVPDAKGYYSAVGEIDSIHSRIYVKFTNEASGKLHAVITPIHGDGNIRFNQILYPDKTADGPFGKELELELKQTGEHTLIIGHSLMADGQYQGKFKVELKLSH